MQEFRIEKKEYTKQDIVSLLKITDKSALSDLYKLANTIREKYTGIYVDLRGSIQFSTFCSKNCLHCGIRKSNDRSERYRMDKNQLLKYAVLAEKSGYKTILFKSGEDDQFDIETVTDIIKTIKRTTKLSIALGIGERPEIEYKLMREAGADKYTLNHETSDPILYRKLHPDTKYSNRIKSLRALKQLGFETGSGIKIGLPGQTFESLANDILLFKELDIDLIEIVPYIAHPDTPLAKKFDQAGGYFAPAIGYFDIEEMISKVIAITRIVTKNTKIQATVTAKNANESYVMETILQHGANIIMISLTDPDLSKFKDIYSNTKKICFSEDHNSSLKHIKDLIKDSDRQTI